MIKKKTRHFEFDSDERALILMALGRYKTEVNDNIRTCENARNYPSDADWVKAAKANLKGYRMDLDLLESLIKYLGA